MGWKEKAKQLAEQAQTKLDEVQKQINTPTQGGSNPASANAPTVEYDKHGRPVNQPPAPHGDPVASAPPPTGPPSPGPAPTPPAPPAATTPQPAQPPKPPSGGSGLTSGDPLAG